MGFPGKPGFVGFNMLIAKCLNANCYRVAAPWAWKRGCRALVINCLIFSSSFFRKVFFSVLESVKKEGSLSNRVYCFSTPGRSMLIVIWNKIVFLLFIFSAFSLWRYPAASAAIIRFPPTGGFFVQGHVKRLIYIRRNQTGKSYKNYIFF